MRVNPLIESGFKRAFYALGIFLAGLHLVGFGIWKNGNATASNPTWNFISAVWNFELLLLKIILGCFLIFVLIVITKLLATNEEAKKSISETIEHPKKLNFTQTAKPKDIQLPVAKHQATSTQNIISNPEPPKPEPLSAEELKRRALKQITGKEF